MSKRLKYLLLVPFICMCINVFAQRSDNTHLTRKIVRITDPLKSEKVIFSVLDSLEKTKNFKNRYYFLEDLLSGYHAEKDIKQEAFVLNLIGNLYVDAGYYYNGISYHKKAGIIYDSLKNYSGLNNVYTNIGNSFYYIEDFDTALEYYLKALAYAQKGPQSERMDQKIANDYNNIGTVYGIKEKYSLALLYFRKTLNIAEKRKDSAAIAHALNNVAQVYYFTNKVDSAEILMDLSYDIKLKHGDLYDKIEALNKKADASIRRKLPKAAIDLSNQALTLIDTVSMLGPLSTLYHNMYMSYNLLGDIKNEYKYYRLYETVNDSLETRNKSNDIIKEKFQSDFNVIRVADSLEAVNQLGIRDLKLQEKKKQSYFLIVILILTGIALALIYSRFKVTQKQKLLIQQQKNQVDEKNKEITDSINYAKRLQDAILPSEKQIALQVKECFVIYNPKDIVSGDFYFFEKKKDTLFIAAADCTGHGVPGAMLSIACYNALQRAIIEFDLSEPGKILDAVKKNVVEHFNKTENNINDGMDVSLLAINYAEKKAEWAGANNRLFYIQNDVLTEVKPDRQPVGKSDSEKPFTTQRLEFVDGTMFYLFTDGMVDQFGGENSKKFTVNKLRSLLEEIKGKELSDQKQILSDVIKNWKGKNEQTDDVTILGVRI